ncbi:MAG TPA: hypothetical protein VFF14_00480 [Candidatus Deferrimicrobium sp.]|nr:hypothetical protein [Candidatus Deferrimicrobium sp.]
MKIIYLSVFTLKDYFRRTWLSAEIIMIAILILLYLDQYWLLSKSEVYPALGIFSLVLVTVNSLRMTNLETNSRIYVPLTKALSRGDYIAGKAVAVLSLDTAILTLMYVLSFLLTSVKQQFSFATGLFHLIPLLGVLLIAEGIILCCSPLVSHKLSFFWGVLILVFGSAQPWKITTYVFPPIKQLIISSYENNNLLTLSQYFLAIVYIVGFYSLALYLFGKRELDFEQK